jgi:2-keto-4-pentenoate hydratase/2-oxohepta-3-ene-1,7-dioic acid hydratase in catechol pathway
MRLCMFSPRGRDLERGWPGRIDGDRVIQLAAQTLQSFFTGGGTAREHAEHALGDVVLRPPVLHPPSIRDFTSPRAFHFANPASICGPEDDVAYPEGTAELDFELELALVIGDAGRPGGVTIMNDWTARDLERDELAAGAGPAKSKDFATSIGPVVVTPDELDASDLSAAARVNGKERGRMRTSLSGVDELVAYAARNTRLVPGDVIGLGALVTGNGRGLRRGDIVELEVGGIGVLRNRVAAEPT